MRIISLGAGVQSSTMLLMALEGEIKADCAIFADTQWEPAVVYDHLEYLQMLADAQGFPIHRVTAGNIREAALAGSRNASLPVHILNPKGDNAMLRRQCTREFKIAPLEKKMRELGGAKPKGRMPKGVIIDVLIGISLDEVQRMRDSRHYWSRNEYPLIDRRMSRHDCENWMLARGFKRPTKSACKGCPFHDNRTWRRMKDESPEDWADVVEFDAAIRSSLHNVDCQAFLHRSLLPLPMVDLSTPEERGQVNLFENECEGMCGV